MKKDFLGYIFMLNIIILSLFLAKYTYHLPLQLCKQYQLIQAINALPSTDAALEKSPYFDTKNLLNDRQKTTAILKRDGFYSVHFYTPDGIKLTGLLLFKPHNKGTIICCEGYHAGTRFDAAALTPLIPDNYNILYFNQRGYHPSKGKSWKNFWFFGLYQYQDIIGAIQFVNTLSSKPIILWGTCAGAFNAVHAVLHMQELALSYPIKGLIFDSGWACLPEAACAFSKNIARKIMNAPTLCKPDSILEKITYGFLVFLKKILLIDYCFAKYDEQTTLLGKMHRISIPVLFIHSKNDLLAPIEHIQPLVAQTPHAFSWIVEESTHAMMHIKQKSQYSQVLTKFLEYVHST